MRILAITNLYPNPYQPNRAPWNRQQLEAVAARHPLRVIAPIAWTDEWTWRRKSGMLLPSSRCITLGGINVEHPRYWYTPKVLRASYGWFFEKSVSKCFDRIVEEHRPEVVLACWAYPDGYAAIQLARRHGLPVAVKVHGSDVHSVNDYQGRVDMTKRCLAEADAIISVSGELRDRVVKLGAAKERVQVVYDGVNSEMFSPGDREAARQKLGLSGRKIVLFVGNLVAVKQVNVLLHAMKEVTQRDADVECQIIGVGPLRQQLEELALSLGIANRVIFQGGQPHAELVNWFRAANVVVLPSRAEGVPNVLLESMACGVPFVASDVGGIGEIADYNSCILVPAGDVSALAMGIEKAVNSNVQPKYSRSFNDSADELVQALELAVSNRNLVQ